MRLFFATSIFLLVQATSARADPIFPNSVTSNNLEFIATTDQSVFSCIVFEARARAEMPDKRHDDLFDDGTFIFQAHFKDGTSVRLWAHSGFGSKSVAYLAVEPVGHALGKLPTIMRSKLSHVVVHKGDEVAFAEADGQFFVLYSDNILSRIRSHDLEETVFHESVHATLDAKLLRSRAWRNAQRADGAFVTDYAARLPEKEDMAESALFAWTIVVHPGRLPQNIEMQVKQIIPNRLAFFEELFLKKPLFHRVGSEQGC